MVKVPYECVYPRVSKKTKDNMFHALDDLVAEVERLKRAKRLNETDLKAIDLLERQAGIMREVINEWEMNVGVKCREI